MLLLANLVCIAPAMGPIKDAICQDAQEDHAEGNAQVHLLQQRAIHENPESVIIGSDGTVPHHLERTSAPSQGLGGIKPGGSQEQTKPTSSDPTLSSFDTDERGNVCILCGKPLPNRAGPKNYSQLRTDCGNRSSEVGPHQDALKMPAVQLYKKGDSTAAVTSNGFCELNFAKSCADAILNEDYLYWAKSMDLSNTNSSAWDARYCSINGFLAPDIVALQHNFTGMKKKGEELCHSKYAKHGIDKLTFMDMLTAARYDLPEPSATHAAVLAAWNCAMGDLGCDIALCAYSFCDVGDGKFGLYDECPGWHPVKGMPVRTPAADHSKA